MGKAINLFTSKYSEKLLAHCNILITNYVDLVTNLGETLKELRALPAIQAIEDLKLPYCDSQSSVNEQLDSGFAARKTY